MKYSIRGLLIFSILMAVHLETHAQNSLNSGALNSPAQNGVFASNASIGQVFFMETTSGTVTEVQGIQQPLTFYTLSTDVENVVAMGTRLYPNPTSGSFNLSIDGWNTELSYRIYDVMGKVMMSETVKAANSKISMDQASSGMYFMHLLENGEPIKVIKIIKQ